MDTAKRILYRPKENHLGVIYQIGRFHRWVEPNEWTLVLQPFQQVRTEIYLGVRRCVLHPNHLLSMDGVPVECEFTIIYRLNPREIKDPGRRIKAIQRTKENWDLLIGSRFQEIASVVFGYASLSKLMSPQGRDCLKKLVAHKLSKEFAGRGVVIDAQKGVMLQYIRPDQSIIDAHIAEQVSMPQGVAALNRVVALLNVIGHHPAGVAQEALKAGYLASVVAGQMPNTLVTLGDGQARGATADAAILRSLFKPNHAEIGDQATISNSDDNSPFGQSDW